MIATADPERGNTPYNVIMEVGPDLALEWLEGNTHNRPLKEAHVKRLSGEITAGRWRVTHQGIAFDTDGLLVDGQHRLWAIVESGQAVTARVFFNEPLDNICVVDSGERRSNLDILTVTDQVGEVTAEDLATLRAMLAGRSSHPVRMTPGEEAEHYQRHREAVEFAVKHLGVSGTSGVATAAIRAVVARAYYSADHAKLAHFCDVVKSGMPSGEPDAPIILLRDFLIRTRKAGRSESVCRLRYAKTEWLLSSFLSGKSVGRLCSSQYELFLLPEEIEAAA